MAHIKVSDEQHHSVVTEGIEICKAGELTEAVCLLMAVHYILDLQYHPKVYNTLIFIQKVILNIQDGEKTPAKVVRCLYDINSIIEQNSSEV